MPELDGVFTSLPLSKISTDLIMRWLPKTFDSKLVENYLGNRILYPSFVPTSEREELLDLAILREALRLTPKNYYDPNLSRIYLPKQFIDYFSDLTKLAWAFIDIFVTNPITTIIIKGNVAKNAGTVLKPKVSSPKASITVTIRNQNKKYTINTSGLTIIPVNLPRVDIQFTATFATLSGQSSIELEVAGGILGLIIDTRT